VSYRLCEHVYWCERNSQVILLDLRADRYLALDPRASSLFPHLVEGNACSTTDKETSELVDALLRRGLLTSGSREGRNDTSVALPAPAFEVTADSFDGCLRLRARDVYAFCFALGKTGIRLRLLSLFHVVTAARTRHARREACLGRTGRSCNLATRVAVFGRLRPLAFTARNACLFESLAMIEFLASFGVDASWVFGVQTAPFCAHCWVQLGDTVINDTVERVRGFTPIMAV
jgi:hypothetical protein